MASFLSISFPAATSHEGNLCVMSLHHVMNPSVTIRADAKVIKQSDIDTTTSMNADRKELETKN
jgi:hypothetical protein